MSSTIETSPFTSAPEGISHFSAPASMIIETSLYNYDVIHVVIVLKRFKTRAVTKCDLISPPAL